MSGTWNNCVPVTIAMNLSCFGRSESQVDSAPFLKPNQDDKNVNPEELAAYARCLGFEALVRVSGDIELLKRLLTGHDEGGDRFITFNSLNENGSYLWV